MKTKRFKRIVIKSKAQLDEIFNSLGWSMQNDFAKMAAIVTGPLTPERILTRWLIEHDVKVCPRGRRRILAAAGKLSSWKEYCQKNWRDKEARRWFASNQRTIFGNYNITTTTSVYVSPFYGWRHEDIPSFEKFLKANPEIKWGKWPFKPKRKRR